MPVLNRTRGRAHRRKGHSTIFTVAQSKGGVGKTATAVEFVRHLSQDGERDVLLIDTDQQGNATARAGLSRQTPVLGTTADVIAGRLSARKTSDDPNATGVAEPSPTMPGVWVLAGTHGLTQVEMLPGTDRRLMDHLEELRGEWDDIVIDTPPNLGPLTQSALAAADCIIAPVDCGTEAYEQLPRLSAVIEHQVCALRPGRRIDWIVPTRFHRGARLDREVVELLQERYPGRVTHTVREAVAVRDAYTARLPIGLYDPRHKVTADYTAAFRTILEGAHHA